jgi:hypothetical protein
VVRQGEVTRAHGGRRVERQVTNFRLTVIDQAGTVSFVSPAHGAKMLAAACSRNPPTLDDLLAVARPYDTELVDTLLDGLALFDEHNAPGNYEAIHEMVETSAPADLPPFRVVDDTTRRASLTSVHSGLILYNLPARRIVQVQNSYCGLLRRDRGRIRASGRPTRHLYRYELPSEWRLVP